MPNIGGIGAELSGGDFLQGAATGATIGLLNHGEHLIKEKSLLNKIFKGLDVIKNQVAKVQLFQEIKDAINGDKVAMMKVQLHFAKLEFFDVDLLIWINEAFGGFEDLNREGYRNGDLNFTPNPIRLYPNGPTFNPPTY